MVTKKNVIEEIDPEVAEIIDDLQGIMKTGKCYFVRTVTYFSVGRFQQVAKLGRSYFAIMEQASWIPETGVSMNECLKGKASADRFDYIGLLAINLDSVVDFMDWPNALPKSK